MIGMDVKVATTLYADGSARDPYKARIMDKIRIGQSDYYVVVKEDGKVKIKSPDLIMEVLDYK